MRTYLARHCDLLLNSVLAHTPELAYRPTVNVSNFSANEKLNCLMKHFAAHTVALYAQW